MAVYGQSDWRTRSSRVSVSSLLLLAVFVAAAVLMVAIVVVQPGIGGDSAAVAPVQSEAGTADGAAAAEVAAPAEEAAVPADAAVVPLAENAGP